MVLLVFFVFFILGGGAQGDGVLDGGGVLVGGGEGAGEGGEGGGWSGGHAVGSASPPLAEQWRPPVSGGGLGGDLGLPTTLYGLLRSFLIAAMCIAFLLLRPIITGDVGEVMVVVEFVVVRWKSQHVRSVVWLGRDWWP